MSTEGRGSHPADTDAVTLDDVGRTLLAAAREARNGHASQLLIGGEHQRAVLMALVGGAQLSDHESPPAATLHVVLGSARLYAVDGPEWTVHTGQLVAIPPQRHGVVALEDCVILLTVALDPPTT
jgi:quercetin dioxygenase-like cupin family protein